MQCEFRRILSRFLFGAGLQSSNVNGVSPPPFPPFFVEKKQGVLIFFCNNKRGALINNRPFRELINGGRRGKDTWRYSIELGSEAAVEPRLVLNPYRPLFV